MGLLSMSQLEHNQWIEYMAESARLMGQECKLYTVKKRVDDINSDPYVEYNSPIPYNILFESQPKPVLKRLGWYNQDDDIPYIAYITALSDNYKSIKLTKYSVIEVPYVQIESSTSKFVITELKGNKINPLFWTVKLVPYTYNLESPKVNTNPEVEDDKSDTTNSYLKYERKHKK